MWWNTVDVSRIPRAPRPKWVSRSPQWHTTTKRVPIEKGGPPVSPLSLCITASKLPVRPPKKKGAASDGPADCFFGAQPTIGRTNTTTNIGSAHPLSRDPDMLRRPKSAPTVSSGATSGAANRPARRRASSKGDAPMGKKLSRPQSAPTMLRGWDGQKTMRPAHEDEFLQMIETCEVNSNIEVFKRQKHISRDKIDGIEMLSDTSLYDLKVLHNGRQRAKSASGRRPESAPVTRDKGSDFAGVQKKHTVDATLRVRDLCDDLVGDLRSHCARFGDLRKDQHIDQSTFEALKEYAAYEDDEARKKRERQELFAGFGGFFKMPAFGDAAEQEVIEEQDTVEPVAKQNEPEPSPEPPSPPLPHRKSVQSIQHAATQRLGELVGFLIGCCGSVAAAFETFDRNGDRILSMQEWESGVMRLGFKDNVSYVFRLLGKGNDGEATLDEIQALFDPFLKDK